MGKNHWSFLHEWVIYEYLISRSRDKTLRIRHIVSGGKLLGKPKWVKVTEQVSITGTSFPDIKSIKLNGAVAARPAEIKFTTSLFNYHRDLKFATKFQDFIEQNGFILVLAHDYIPINGLLNLHPILDVYEIEQEDFVFYCKENFSRLLNRQIKAHTATKIWLMYQGPNFNQGSELISPARESMIWCPTENLSGFDLAPGDRILFYKTGGVDRIKVQNTFYKEGIIHENWMLQEIFVAEVVTKIFSRIEYIQYKKYQPDRQLWKNDEGRELGRWNRVFEFKKIKVIKGSVKLADLYKDQQCVPFVKQALESFCFVKSRELRHEDYRNLLEHLAEGRANLGEDNLSIM